MEEILHEHSLLWTFFEVHTTFDVFCQEIMDLLVINFYETASDEVSLGSVVFRYSYNLLEGSRNDSLGFLILVSTHHSVSLPTTGLSICKNSAVIAL